MGRVEKVLKFAFGPRSLGIDVGKELGKEVLSALRPKKHVAQARELSSYIARSESRAKTKKLEEVVASWRRLLQG